MGHHVHVYPSNPKAIDRPVITRCGMDSICKRTLLAISITSDRPTNRFWPAISNIIKGIFPRHSTVLTFETT